MELRSEWCCGRRNERLGRREDVRLQLPDNGLSNSAGYLEVMSIEVQIQVIEESVSNYKDRQPRVKYALAPWLASSVLAYVRR